MTDSSNDAAIRQRLEHRNKQVKQVLMGACAVAVVVFLIVFIPKWLPDSSSEHDIEAGNVAAESADEVAAQAELEATVAQNKAAREAFKQALVMFEEQIEPQLQNAALVNWDEARVQEVLLEKESALVHFAKGAFVSALSSLEQAQALYETLNSDWQADFELHYQQAQTEFQQKKLAQATLAIQKALSINPDEPKGLALEKKIQDFPEVQALFQQWDVAIAENNLAKQISAMEAIVKLDPSQNAVKQSLTQAKKAHTEQQFAGHIRAAHLAIDTGNIAQAEQSIRLAKRFFSTRKELKAASERLDTLRQTQRTQTLKASVEKAIAADDWTAVLAQSEQGLGVIPNDAYFTEQKALAKRITQATAKAKRFAANPKRLADANIHDAAKQFIQDNIILTTKSPAFAAELQHLQSAMKTAQTPIAITVNSDRRTEIFVLGVGEVGKTSGKTINLPQGDYIFEGRRKGYRNKRIEVSLRAGQPQQSITLVCDERI